MRVSLSWLQQLVQVNDSVDALAERLSMAGFEVDEIDDLSARARALRSSISSTSNPAMERRSASASTESFTWTSCCNQERETRMGEGRKRA